MDDQHTGSRVAVLTRPCEPEIARTRSATLAGLERWVAGHGRLPQQSDVANLTGAIEMHFGSWPAAMRELRSVMALYHGA